ncbi:hypothetical protein [Flavihumibacter sp. ZG627]|uniref:hypothetical protein n=1 Tax=Flavihumibacter sp. ZG627 TaxID=1463156 RepID=UPI0006943A12|nr:hypothetical protein [Flavihumibacter sp. ZG627]
MTRSTSLANRLREVLLNGHWIANTNFKEQLEKISWEQAIQNVDNLNTIAAITFHVNYYIGGLIKVFNGGKLEISDKYSYDFPPIQSSEDWQKLMNDFLFNAEVFCSQVEGMENAQLDQPFVDEKYGSYHRNIEAVIEHSYYHLGQISLLRKMIAERSVPPLDLETSKII